MIKAMANNCPLFLLGTGNRIVVEGKRHRPPAEYQMRTVWLVGGTKQHHRLRYCIVVSSTVHNTSRLDCSVLNSGGAMDIVGQ